MKKMVRFAVLWLAAAAAVVVMGGQFEVSRAAEVTGMCDLRAMASCGEAILTKKRPSPECCNAIEGQFSCLCDLMKDPRYASHKNEAKRVIQDCAIKQQPSPTCF